MRRLVPAGWTAALAAGMSAVLAVGLGLAALPAPVRGALITELTGVPWPASQPAEAAGAHLQPVAATQALPGRTSSQPWRGNRAWSGGSTVRPGDRAPALRTARARWGPIPPRPPVPPVDPVPPGPLEPPNRPWWIGAPTPPACPWPLATTPAPGWHCQMEPMRDCPQYSGPGVQVLLNATPGVRSATLSWWNYGNPDILHYRVAAIRYTARGAPNPTWQIVTVPGGCRQVSTVITGLTSGERYEFMLEGVVRNNLGRGVLLHRGIGKSDLIRIG